ncbi:molybdenum cofactor guanylyltransferase [Clostridium sp.]|jgi:molybdopterin-guanine dinucleotide biosynthesis protein A|uniref:molybdenum cofactor guanylyltransferase n=1 Tax=Clostridium sp. TaxID=1506 RepID=UPI003EE98504
MEKFKTAVILAGGKSSRMGFDKQFLKIKEKRLMDTLISNLKKEFDEIIIVTNKIDKYVEGSYKLVCDEIEGKGPLSGFHIGLKESSSQYVYFIACDMPNINTVYIKFMKEKIRNLDVDACVTRKNDRIEPFNAFYSRKLIYEIEEIIMNNNNSLFSLVNRVNTIYIEEKDAQKYSSDLSMFLNLNDVENLNKYISSE